jgi:hypothetical protein
MATLDLFDNLPPSQADQWHRVRAPGGYEWWELDAEDETQGIRVLISFHDGFAFDPEYARRYDAYRRRPTLHSPPVPRQYPCVQFAIFEKEAIVAGNTVHFPEGAFQYDPKSNAVTIGANRLELGIEETRVQIQGGGVAISMEMVFRRKSLALPLEQAIPQFEFGAEHHWVLAKPRCDVEGQISFNGRQVKFHAIGCQDHYYGGWPIGPTVRRWLRGRAMLPRRTVAFHVRTDQANGTDEFIAVESDDAGIHRIAQGGCFCDWNRRARRGLSFPSAVNFGESLVLRRPRVVYASPTSLLVLFDAFVDGETCKAWGEIVYPARLHKGLAHWGVMKWLEG